MNHAKRRRLARAAERNARAAARAARQPAPVINTIPCADCGVPLTMQSLYTVVDGETICMACAGMPDAQACARCGFPTTEANAGAGFTSDEGEELICQSCCDNDRELLAWRAEMRAHCPLCATGRRHPS